MIEVRTKLRKWGNSFGIIVPQKAVNDIGIREGEEIIFLIQKENDNPVKKVFGALKGWKIDSQKIKDEIRKEEFEAEKRKWKHLNLSF